MPPTIAAAYAVPPAVVAAVVAVDVPWIARKSKSILSVVDNTAVAQALQAPFRITDDRQRIEWPSGHAVDVAYLLDPQKAEIHFVSWRAGAARRGITREELLGCWQTAAGYTLLEEDGNARIKMVGKGTATDRVGAWEWRFVDPQQFQLFRRDAADAYTYRVAAFDGRAMIVTVVTRVAIGGDGHVIEIPTVWKRSKPPRSWQ